MNLLSNKTPENRLAFAILFKIFQYKGKFPQDALEIPDPILKYIAKQVSVSADTLSRFDFSGRSAKLHRVQIREYFGFRTSTIEDMDLLAEWLRAKVLNQDTDLSWIKEQAYIELRKRQLEPPTQGRMERFLRSIIKLHEEEIFQNTYNQITTQTIKQMDRLIYLWTEEPDSGAEEMPISFRELVSDPGRVGLDSIFQEIKKLQTIRELELPENLFSHLPAKMLKKYRQRAVSEDIRELRRHPDPIRYTLLAAFFWSRSREITDSLVELLIQIVHRIGARAEKKVEREILHDLKKVNGKTNLLYRMAEKALEHPDGIIKEILYPVVNEQTLKDLVKEIKHTGPAFRQKVYTVMRASYGAHYRRMVPQILDILHFKSNNELHRPVIEALELLKKYANTNHRFYAEDDNIPIEGVVRSSWLDTVLDKEENRINRITYEISVLQAVRDKLRCKEIWVVGADRYRNPEEDLPADFESHRIEHYAALKQPIEAEDFIEKLKQRMHTSLEKLDKGMRQNQKVRILSKGSGWISVTPLDAQPEPKHITAIKTEIMKKWSMTSLLDIYKRPIYK